MADAHNEIGATFGVVPRRPADYAHVRLTWNAPLNTLLAARV